MTGVSMISQFPTNSVSLMSPVSKPSSKTPMLTSHSVRFPAKTSTKSKVRFAGGARKKFSFTLRAAGDDGFEPEGNETYSVVAEEPITEIGLLKKQLVETFYGTNFGLSATSETRAEIVELITQLEVMNPTPEPTKALPLLNGKWILAYTSFVGLYPLLSHGTIPLVKVEEISQTIDSENFTVQNCVVFAGPGSTTAISANATFEIQSPKRVQIKFDEGIIGTPQLTDSIEIPESIEILGQNVDLSPFKGLITSVEDTASHVAKTISSQPPWKFSISEGKVESWLLTTYLDEEVRISRGDGGKVFVLFKEGSSLLSS
ncbi:putative plastid-lipid-associated protein [Helianthus annuus]|uniref:Plastid-lipid-associated protein n=1 Tax=Helianthus annuus TaxID=4232 RepID=A0A251RZW2_HELAN|nr:light-induced protein, chloroplastic [Helianthus annuus]KAF5760523.1 putative plastid-lipid-associated protein [Helianthus annuus]KAJ0641309.1 putative plastid-lipid-associated protein [Helianthus annuus]KAJ0821685.1 putative plastid-lipid-associated protein [Helianthus annuus]